MDATGHLPCPAGSADRLVATVSVPSVPPSWLNALCIGGRLVTTVAGTSLSVTAEKDPEGGATGRVKWDRAGFMHARHGQDYPPGATDLLGMAEVADGEGEYVARGRYPIVDVANAWDLASMLELTAPGIAHHYREGGEQRTAFMAHGDGSWARATAAGPEQPLVHQGGTRRPSVHQARRHDDPRPREVASEVELTQRSAASSRS
ncbi:hypothetical protein [Streptomyces sp. JJ36]|uniref:hypothetical protein n=1 Tax=Streptomyces sp. JJ36 TaxID=2736645 RepID=UPI001F314637|nr:hypothetical protein [Streptomyces sp. JJ36]MCF6525247.1 hypothetical protein [Streptomyces sp. JJ36]